VEFRPLEPDQVDELFDDPRLLPFEFHLRHGRMQFIELGPENYRTEAFHDRRLLNVRPEPLGFSANIDDLLREHEHHAKPAPLGRYVFHTAFCGSTLLSRLLDQLGDTFVYREPLALTRLAQRKPQMSNPNQMANWRRVFDLVAALHSRTFESDDVPIVKLHDNCSYLGSDLLEINNRSRGIVLYSSLPEFILSCLKHQRRHTWIRERFVSSDRSNCPALQQLDPDPLDAAQIAACHWIVQRHDVVRALTRHPQQLSSLGFDDLLADPAAGLRATAEHFDLACSDEQIQRAVSHTLGTHAKTGEAMGDTDEAKRAGERERFAARIEATVEWVQPYLELYPLPDEMPQPLSVS
jgi:hypothetical protein